MIGKKMLLGAGFVGLLGIVLSGVPVYADDPAEIKNANKRLKAEIENLTLDRNNLLKQAKMFQSEKNELIQKIEAMQGESSGAEVQLESLQSETSILSSEIEKLKMAREKDRALFIEEKQLLERYNEDQRARADSLAQTMEKYTPEKIEGVVQDRNRLETENQRLAQRIFEMEKRQEELKRQMTPLELDREELVKIHEENKEIRKKLHYVGKLEARQAQLIKENAEYREQLEIMKAKFKDAAPGLAKASRISQKMMRENADMHYNLGTIFLHNKKFKEAIQEYEAVLELRPSDPPTHYNLGVLYDDYLKNREKALYHYQRYLSVNPKAMDAKKVESFILSLELEQKVR